MMNVELTAENRPACVTFGFSDQCGYGNTRTYEDEGCVQVLVVLLRIVSVKLFGLSAVYGEEVGSGIVDSEGFEELLEGGMEASR